MYTNIDSQSMFVFTRVNENVCVGVNIFPNTHIKLPTEGANTFADEAPKKKINMV